VDLESGKSEDLERQMGGFTNYILHSILPKDIRLGCNGKCFNL
jgi:hypothetical protein